MTARTVPPLVGLAKLARAVRARCPDHAALRDFGQATGLGYAVMANARAGRPLAAAHYLRLCAALALDPVTLKAASADAPGFGGAVLWWMAGAAFQLARHDRGHDLRKAAKAARLSLASASRLENGHGMSAATLMRAAAYCGLHPHVWTATSDPKDDARPARAPLVAGSDADCFTGNMR